MSNVVRIQLHLTDRQDRALRARARSSDMTRAALIRRAVDLFLAQETSEGDALIELIGSAGPASQADLSERHDQVVYKNDPQPLPEVAERSRKK